MQLVIKASHAWKPPEPAVRKDSGHLDPGGLEGPPPVLAGFPGTETNIFPADASTNGPDTCPSRRLPGFREGCKRRRAPPLPRCEQTRC